MPVIRVDAGQPPDAALWRAARDLPAGAPIVVMIHGYRYSPARAHCDPHRHILSVAPDPARPRAVSWPVALGLDSGDPAQGLGIAFGWEARGRLGRAYRQAAVAGADLAQVVARIGDLSGRPVALIGHSLGARVALQAVVGAGAGPVGRVILLTGAEFRDTAAEAADSPGGRAAEIVNVTSRENDLFDFALELWLGRGRREVLGFGLDHPRPHWLDIQIDDGATLAALAGMGFAVDRSSLRLSHWTPYLRRGLFDFYRCALCQPWALPMNVLRTRLPGRAEPRWSRLLAAPGKAGGLRA